MRLSFHSSLIRKVLIAGVALLALTLTGWLVDSFSLSSLCVGLPLCMPGASLGWLPLLHRLMAGIAGVFILSVFQIAWREQRHHLVILPLTTICTMMFFGQTFVGAFRGNKSRSPPPCLTWADDDFIMDIAAGARLHFRSANRRRKKDSQPVSPSTTEGFSDSYQTLDRCPPAGHNDCRPGDRLWGSASVLPCFLDSTRRRAGSRRLLCSEPIY